jgi:hypothetical protein
VEPSDRGRLSKPTGMKVAAVAVPQSACGRTTSASAIPGKLARPVTRPLRSSKRGSLDPRPRRGLARPTDAPDVLGVNAWRKSRPRK